MMRTGAGVQKGRGKTIFFKEFVVWCSPGRLMRAMGSQGAHDPDIYSSPLVVSGKEIGTGMGHTSTSIWTLP